MIDSNGNKLVPKKSELRSEAITEIKFLMKNFAGNSNLMNATAVISALKSATEDADLLLSFKPEELEYIENTVVTIEDYVYGVDNYDLLWEMVRLRRRLAYGVTKLKEVDCKFIAALHFDRICTIQPTSYNYGARFLQYADTVKKISDEGNDDVKDKWNADKVTKLFRRAENFAESKSFLTDDEYLHNVCYYYDAKRIYYRKISDKLSEYLAAKIEIQYMWKRYRHGKSPEVLKKLIMLYTDYTQFEWYSYHNEKQHFKTLIEWTMAWHQQEKTSESEEYLHRLLRCWSGFAN